MTLRKLTLFHSDSWWYGSEECLVYVELCVGSRLY